MAFTPRQQNWRWYDNDAAEPSNPLADENVAPSILLDKGIVRLRVTVAEIGGTSGSGTITLEYSTDDTNFSPVGAQGDQAEHWNYANGLATPGGTTTTYKTTDATTHGLYHESGTTSESWAANAIREMDIALAPAAWCEQATYYFRVKIGVNVVPLNTGESHPSIVVAAQTGLNVSKANVLTVLSPPKGLVVSKANAYVVLTPIPRLKASQVEGQVEHEVTSSPPHLAVTRVGGQAEVIENNRIDVSHVEGQVEYVGLPGGIITFQTIGQVEYTTLGKVPSMFLVIPF